MTRPGLRPDDGREPDDYPDSWEYGRRVHMMAQQGCGRCGQPLVSVRETVYDTTTSLLVHTHCPAPGGSPDSGERKASGGRI